MLTSYATCEARGSTGRLCVARPQPWGTPVAPRVAARPTPVRHTPLWYIFVCSVFAARCWWPIVDQPTVRAQLLKGQRPQAHTQAMGQARAPRARVLRLRAPIFSFQSLCWRSQGRKRHVFVESSPRDACHLLQRRTLPQTSFPRTKPHSNNYPGHLRGKTKHAQPRCPVHQVACLVKGREPRLIEARVRRLGRSPRQWQQRLPAFHQAGSSVRRRISSRSAEALQLCTRQQPRPCHRQGL